MKTLRPNRGRALYRDNRLESFFLQNDAKWGGGGPKTSTRNHIPCCRSFRTAVVIIIIKYQNGNKKKNTINIMCTIGESNI